MRTLALQILRDESSNHATICAVIEELHGSIIMEEVEPKCRQHQQEDVQCPLAFDELCLDFIMDDGISTLSGVIQSKRLSPEHASQCLDVILRVCGDSACHWREFWVAFGQRDGMIQFLEKYSTTSEIFKRTLGMLRRISQFHLLGARARDSLRWMPFWDLLLEAMENSLEGEEGSETLCTFCKLLQTQGDEHMPYEMHGRVVIILRRALRANDAHLSFRTSISPRGNILAVLARFEGRLSSTSRRARKKWGNGVNPSMFIPCSAAA